ncbi:MAG: carbamoyl phosphate synthase large subunit [Candidatus Omnitrophica bacterium CG1_02_44_16]|nr:MAG: carbamoyl phosphate synthase large subunit [Candidatus Omnitrophica bacterium CG1_02_44_16]PIY82913.1 MAG: carbamoyl phosphate synthase large subunit [Candidatus Omnitrophica bacterium CG_4_10_14_0_8_um_filter_44_12]PIZ83919.1 MAG: carbamoyl phosphate synthase large subunit [Candidatus Omnitrophica bacterium CG_4_10_14_0_2_um_filter_44_9]
MPKRKDIKKIMIIGSGPIIISQACEFDYSGTQACKALKEEGYKVILVNSNPATIMTDPEFADATYIEPVTPEVVEKIIAKERPDALLATMGGQTGLNVAIAVAKKGVLKKYGVEMIGADRRAIEKAEDRDLFKKAMLKIGLDLPRSINVKSKAQARKAVASLGLPVVIRPSFTLGGTGGGIAFNMQEFEELISGGLEYSMIHEVLLEESVIGWKEFELEVMRDRKDNVIIICSIENFDPMGVHTGDSITVAPAQTLTDVEYQNMRDAAIRAIREIGVDTGGCNVQFAINPKNGRMVMIEINPRVSRSSALASKATGFPIAKIAAKLAVGYTLDEIPNDITKETPACFEPTIDYCVVKIPRFTFEKFPGADSRLGTSMKSVGEAMAIGRTFKEALQKGLRSLEIKKSGLDSVVREKDFDTRERLMEHITQKLIIPNDARIFYIGDALRFGMPLSEIQSLTAIDAWFLENIKDIIDFEAILKNSKMAKELLRRAKELGFSDKQIASLTNSAEDEITSLRGASGIVTTYKLVDTCAAEFEAYTPYFYSTYEIEDEVRVLDKKKVMILGGGPNRIGQGIEFDYCCVHASFALKEIGCETIMVNCNPETVSTDYDTSDKLYFEPMTKEDVLNIAAKEKPWGVIVQLGGQTPINLTLSLQKAGVNIIGTSPESIDIAEDREKFKNMLDKLKLRQPPNGTARTFDEAKAVASRISYPVLVRPSYVLGGRAMEIVYDEDTLEKFIIEASKVSGEHPVLIDKFLEDAIEVDVDMIADGETFVVAGILEHIEEAGIHSGDSAMVLPPYSLGESVIDKIRQATVAMAKELKVVGLMNVQYAVRDNKVYILEVNPRASRTVPFVSKAIGVPLAKLAAKVMAGMKLKDLKFTEEIIPKYSSVKESVFPFNRFPGVDIMLGPEMRSTGEVMGIDEDFGRAYMKSQLAAGQILPVKGNVFISVRDKDKRNIIFIAKRLSDIGFGIVATGGTAKALKKNGMDVQVLKKVYEGGPNILDYIKDGKIDLIINTPSGRMPREDEVKIRSTAIMHGVPCITTISGAQASVNGIEALLKKDLGVKTLQAYHKSVDR